jgi:hypothetical protein
VISDYARNTLGVTETDAHTARNIHLSVADCRHIKTMLLQLNKAICYTDISPADFPAVLRWNDSLIDYFKGAI